MSEKDILVNTIILGNDIAYSRLSLNNVKNFVKGKKKYQVHLENSEISELYDKPEDAVTRYLEIRKRLKHE